MTNEDFSNAFDTLLNSYSGSNAFGVTNGPLELDEYEKSLFLTKAQEQLVISLYSGKNTSGDSFESSEELRRYLEPLVLQENISKDKAINPTYKLVSNSTVFKLNDNVLFIVYEAVDWTKSELGCKTYENITVQPVTHDEYHRIKNNPFRGANDHRVLRLDYNASDSPQYIELISTHTIATYKYRYIKKPSPIILENLEGVTINGESTESSCELHESLHQKILDLAVALALQSRNLKTNN